MCLYMRMEHSIGRKPGMRNAGCRTKDAGSRVQSPGCRGNRDGSGVASRLSVCGFASVLCAEGRYNHDVLRGGGGSGRTSCFGGATLSVITTDLHRCASK
ncbi:hypothetical protein PUN28_014500 [Cardiocondyla obscurior]|uniref:Uncharacterized protein n=1 Tax=Cardiocondyla obscurior TaxID=286306 RepID=A0AAW2F1R5_9HYME